jgi:hypothetical protein
MARKEEQAFLDNFLLLSWSISEICLLWQQSDEVRDVCVCVLLVTPCDYINFPLVTVTMGDHLFGVVIFVKTECHGNM